MLRAAWEKCIAGLLPALEVPRRHARQQREDRYSKAECVLDAGTHV